MLKSKETGLSKSWTVVKRQGASYTGGPISVSRDGAVAACMCNDHAALLDLRSGAVLKFLPPEVCVREGMHRPKCRGVARTCSQNP